MTGAVYVSDHDATRASAASGYLVTGAFVVTLRERPAGVEFAVTIGVRDLLSRLSHIACASFKRVGGLLQDRSPCHV